MSDPRVRSRPEPAVRAEIDRLTARLFEAISFAPGTAPTMRDILDLFVPGGLLVDYQTGDCRVRTVERFVRDFERGVRGGDPPGLEDREVASSTWVGQDVVHRRSAYEARFHPDDARPFAVGVNSITFVRTPGGWRILSMAWSDRIPPADPSQEDP